MNDFEVTHTKDGIYWEGGEEDDFEAELKKACSDFIHVAGSHRKARAGNPDERAVGEQDIRLASSAVKEEIGSSEMIDTLRMVKAPPPKLSMIAKQEILENLKKRESAPAFEACIDDLTVSVFIEALSVDDIYVTSECSGGNKITVVVNLNHPHFHEIDREMGLINYLRHCIYDALAEYKAQQLTQNIDPDTVKRFKDQFLRVKLLIENHEREST